MNSGRPDPAPAASIPVDGSVGAAEPLRTDEELLAAYVQGDEPAFEELFARTGGRLFAFVRRYLGDHHMAEDVYQEVCMKAARGAGGFARRASAATWLFQIARNACLDALRRQGRRPRLVRLEYGEAVPPVDPTARASDPVQDPPAAAERAELGEVIVRAVEALPAAQREVFLLKEEAGLTFEEIGRLTGTGKDTAKSRMRYALERLRTSLGPEVRDHGLP